MKRALVNALAVVGALTLLGSVLAQIPEWAYEGATGIVMGPNDTPAAKVPVFLNRGDGMIERFLTDSIGRFSLPIEYANLERAVWLICVPGGIPAVGHRERGTVGPATYGYSTLTPGSLWPAHAFGWNGPIPRGCAADSTYRWRFPPEAGKPPLAATAIEPDWDSYR